MNIWWIFMIVIGLLNLTAAIVLALKLRKKTVPLLTVLGFVFLTVAAYRCAFPSSYPDLLAWSNTGFNSPFLIRCFAFFAELSFIGMIAVILRKFCKSTGVKGFLSYTPLISFGCIALAQIFAFWGLISQYLLPFALEETLWFLAFAFIVPLVFRGLKKAGNKYHKTFFVVLAVWCVGYLIFQAYSLPFTYYANIGQDAGKIAGTLHDAVFNYTATRDYVTWGGLPFFIWHTGYFSLCSWMTLLFISAPKQSEAPSA